MKRNIIFFVFFLLAMGILFSLPEKQTDALSGSVRDAFVVQQTGLRRLREWFRAVFSDKFELLLENRRLRIQNEKLRNEIRGYQPLQEENQELRALLKLKADSGCQLLSAELIVHDVNGWWQMIRIDKGAADGVRPDLPVISPEGLLGQTVEVSQHTADVLLLTNPKLKVAGRIGRADIFGIVHGQGVNFQGGAGYRMDFMLKDAEVSRADEVVTSGLGGVYPAGLVIGYVENVQTDASGLFQCADINPAADFKALDIVFVVLPEKSQAAPDDKSGERRIAPERSRPGAGKRSTGGRP